jgi:hypothetical protein
MRQEGESVKGLSGHHLVLLWDAIQQRQNVYISNRLWIARQGQLLLWQ